MLTAICIPAIDSSTEKATLLRVLVAPGEQIIKGAPVAEIETEKATFPVESPVTGRVDRVLAKDGAELPVGAALVALETDDSTATPYHEDDQAAAPQPASRSAAQGMYSCTQPKNVLFNAGSPAPAITVPPPLKYGGGGEQSASKFAARNVPVAESRKLIGSALRTQQRMSYAARNVPTSSVSVPLETGTLRDRVQAHRTATKQLINPTDVIIWAAGRALQDFPELNAYRDGDELRLYGHVNIGVVYDVKGELNVPSILNAGAMSPAEVSNELRTLYKQLTAKSLPIEKLGVATFVVSNLFGSAATQAHPLVNAGNSGVLLIGAPYQQPLSDESGMRFAEHVNLILGFDHSVVNGMRGSSFLRAVAKLVESAELQGA